MSQSAWLLLRASRFVRLGIIITFTIAMMGATGCMSISLWKPRPNISKADPPILRTATSEEILARINENAYSEFSPEGLRSYRCDDVRVRMQGIPSSMRASLVVEAPRNLRLRVANPLSGGEAVDIGSNEQEFWFWAKDSQPQNVLVCSHDQIAAASQVTTLPLPFRPDWLMEVLGVTPISGSDYEIRKERENSSIVELISTQRTPDQKPVRRIVKINMQYGVVLEHRVESLEGQMIAKATLARHFRDPSTKLILPRQISIDWPAADQHLKLSLEFETVEFNSPSENDTMWRIPHMAGYPPFDIGEYAMRQLGRQPDSLRAHHTDGPQTGLVGKSTFDDMEDTDGMPLAEVPDDRGYEQEAAGASDQIWSEPSDSSALDTIERPIRPAARSSSSSGPFYDDADDQLPEDDELNRQGMSDDTIDEFDEEQEESSSFPPEQGLVNPRPFPSGE